MPIDPSTISSNELPPDDATRQAIAHGHIVIELDEQGQLVACDAQEIDLFPRLVPLQFARSVVFDKYPVLTDARGLPTEEEKKASPAMFCRNVQRSSSHLNPYQVASDLLRAFEEPEEKPAFSVELENARRRLQQTKSEAHLSHDRRFREPIDHLLSSLEKEGFPLTIEAISRDIPQNRRAFYHALRYAHSRARVLLSWYEKQTLYVMRTVSLDSSIADRYTVLSSDRHRAEVEFAATYLMNRAYSGEIDRWELYANDALLRTAKRLEHYDDLINLSALWSERSDEQIFTWLI